MNGKYQLELIKYLSQTKEGQKYIPLLSEELFDDPLLRMCFDMLKSYQKDYNAFPQEINLAHYFEQSSVGIDQKVRDKVDSFISKMFSPMLVELGQIRETVLQFAQEKMAIKMFEEYYDKLSEPTTFKQVRNAMNDIISLEDKIQGKEEDPKLGFILASYEPTKDYSIGVGIPTFLTVLNAMTAIGGFTAPQLVVFMAAPKSFKTGVLLNIALGYVSSGKKVLWIDLENGEKLMKMRTHQYLAAATVKELPDDDTQQTLKSMVSMYKSRGGDIYIKSLPAHVATMQDVENLLDMLEADFGWIPDILAIDYLDLMKPIDRNIKEKRLQIQAVYFDAKNISSKRNLLTFSLSQVNREAVNKKNIDLTAFSEDFGKAANCDAAFAILATKPERKAGIMRITPVVQRLGIAFTGLDSDTCWIKTDYPRQRIEEIDMQQAEMLIIESQSGDQNDN
jgi:replicative DNA helicase